MYKFALVCVAFFLVACSSEPGPLSPDALPPPRCTIVGGFSCPQFSITDAGVSFVVANMLGVDAENVIVKLDNVECGISEERSVGNLKHAQTTESLFFACDVEGTFRGDIIIVYTRAGESLNYTTMGNLFGQPR